MQHAPMGVRVQLRFLTGNEPFSTVAVEAEAMIHATITVGAGIPLDMGPTQLGVSWRNANARCLNANLHFIVDRDAELIRHF